MKSMQSLEFKFSTSLSVSQRDAFDGLCHHLSRWWPSHYFTSKQTKRMMLIPSVGGSLYEDMGEGLGLEWARVITLIPHDRIDFKGHLFPDFGGPATSFLSFVFSNDNNKGSVLEVSESIIGHIETKLISDMEQGWKEIIESNYKPYVQSLYNK